MRRNNLETYSDPVTYDLESSRPKLDSSFLLEYATQASGPVLELGCGTGRITIPLARMGVNMTGLDVLPHMIKHARTKAAELPIQWVCDDVCHFQLDTKYVLIFTWGAVFQHLLERSQQEAMLRRVRDHLAPGGRFVVDVVFKHPESMVDTVEEQEWYSYEDNLGHQVSVTGTDRFDHVNQIWYQTMYRRWYEDGKPVVEGPSELAMRYFMPQEMESLLQCNGFEVIQRYGNWEGIPLQEDSPLQIYVCRVRP